MSGPTTEQAAAARVEVRMPTLPYQTMREQLVEAMRPRFGKAVTTWPTHELLERLIEHNAQLQRLVEAHQAAQLKDAEVRAEQWSARQQLVRLLEQEVRRLAAERNEWRQQCYNLRHALKAAGLDDEAAARGPYSDPNGQA